MYIKRAAEEAVLIDEIQYATQLLPYIKMAFYNFLTVAAARTAKPIVYEEIAKEASISSPAAKKWLSLLVSSRIVAIAQPYSNSALKRVTKIPLLPQGRHQNFSCPRASRNSKIRIPCQSETHRWYGRGRLHGKRCAADR